MSFLFLWKVSYTDQQNISLLGEIARNYGVTWDVLKLHLVNGVGELQPRPQAYTRYAGEPSYQPEAWNRAR